MAEPSPVSLVVEQFRSAVSSGKNWYMALLEAAGQWPVAAETVDGAGYRYVIAAEALDLGQIAQRLLEASGDIIPQEEQLALLFRGRPPVELSPDELKHHLGEEKYRQHLNYFYGVTVEEALLEVAEEEVRKEERGVRARSDEWVSGEAFSRIYGQPQPELLSSFRGGKKASGDDIGLAEMKEFTYCSSDTAWLTPTPKSGPRIPKRRWAGLKNTPPGDCGDYFS